MGQFSIFVPAVKAGTGGGIVISQMYPGATGTGSHEFVELYNNSALPIKVSNWCVKYTSEADESPKTLGCLVAADENTDLWLPSRGYAVFVSNEFNTHTPVFADGYFKGTIVAKDRHVILVNQLGNEMDRLGWGNANNPESSATPNPSNGKSLLRKNLDFGLQDTNNNSIDFTEADPLIHATSVYEEEALLDVCKNLDDIQTELPAGYLYDGNDDCRQDSCLNIDGLQISVPDGYESDDAGNCTAHDECENIEGIQAEIPAYMVREGANDCAWSILPLVLTELYPNTVGSDAGNEFIEIYNPTDETIDLSLYTISVGLNGEDTYTFPIGATIGPEEYMAFDDSIINFTLVNTTSRVVLVGVDGNEYGDSGEYEDPHEGESWALIGSDWQYTNRPTPDAPNLASLDEEQEENSDDGLGPCPVGKFRNPETNRCKSIVSSTSGLSPCAPGQFRNPETNRCKKIETSNLTPCKEGQYRSPETNRCRNLSSANTTLKPCKPSQERNPLTNRCRKATSDGVPIADYKVESVKDSPMVFAGWWALAGVGALAGGYAVWEWRNELAKMWKKVLGTVRR